MGHIISLAYWIFAFWLIRRDNAARGGLPGSLWVPTVWIFIQLSRPLSQWVGFGGGSDSLEGSPLDRAFYFGAIFISLYFLSKRNVNWSLMFSQNWPIFLFYGFFLISVIWADSPVSSFKRWFKDLGNIWVAAVILTEAKPLEALRTAYVRCAYIVIPLSEIYIRWLPSMGRRYSRGGALEVTGVTTQKNTLGMMAVICCLMLIWDYFERTKPGAKPMKRFDRYLLIGMLFFGGYMLYYSDSVTSMMCMTLGTLILFSMRLPLLRRQVGALGGYTLGAIGLFFFSDWFFGGVKEGLVGSMGRDMTFTGRTDVWRELLNLHTDPIIGTGFCSIWSTERYLNQLPYWVSGSAHNGYLETYLDGGAFGLFFLGVLLIANAWRANAMLGKGSNYALIRFSFLLIIIIGSYSESHFGRMGPLWFIFLLTSVSVPRRQRTVIQRESTEADFERLPEKRISAMPAFSSLPA